MTDPSHAVVPDVDVEINDDRKGNVQSTRTDREGVYRFFFLAPSPYTLTVTHPGFQEEGRAVNVLLGPPGTVNVALEIAKTSSEITVTDEVPNIQAENGDVSTTMNQKQISEVPNPGNDLTYIAQTAPGVIMNSDSGASSSSAPKAPSRSVVLIRRRESSSLRMELASGVSCVRSRANRSTCRLAPFIRSPWTVSVLFSVVEI